MILKNLDPLNFANSTRSVIKKLIDHVIEAIIFKGNFWKQDIIWRISSLKDSSSLFASALLFQSTKLSVNPSKL